MERASSEEGGGRSHELPVDQYFVGGKGSSWIMSIKLGIMSVQRKTLLGDLVRT